MYCCAGLDVPELPRGLPLVLCAPSIPGGGGPWGIV